MTQLPVIEPRRVVQRRYQVEVHTHGKGRWVRLGTQHLSKIQAHAWASKRGYITRAEATNGGRQTVYRLVEVADDVA